MHTNAHWPDTICPPHITCLLSINKHSYVRGLPGKHGMCISLVLTLSHKPGIVQIHTNLTSFTPLGCELLHRANSKRGDPWAGCAVVLCTTFGNYVSKWSHFCIFPFHQRNLQRAVCFQPQLHVKSIPLSLMAQDIMSTLEHTRATITSKFPSQNVNMPHLLFINAIVSVTPCADRCKSWPAEEEDIGT